MSESLRPLFELGVLAAALVLAGFAALLQRKPEVSPDWPPSPPPPRDIRRDLVVVGGSVLLIVAGIGVAGIAVTAAIFQAVMSSSA